MKINHTKIHRALKCGEKLPRKAKKKFMWLKMGKDTVKRLLQYEKMPFNWLNTPWSVIEHNLKLRRKEK